MSRQHLFSVSLAAALALASQAAGAAPVIISNPVRAPLPADTGNGLCIASAVSATPEIDFPTQAPLYNGALNAFIEAHEKDRVTSVVRTVLDLSNNNILGGLKVSFGDFTNPMPGLCQEGGCGFFINDTTTSFASRIRGFLNVTEDLVNKPVHIGLYADDAVSVALFDKNGTSYNVVLRPPQLGKATWRTTNQVTFQQPGFYPIEILYAQIANDAALEMSLFVDEKNEFTDFELPVNQAGTANLQKAGFSLFTPGYFFQTLSGAPAYPDPATCDQCDRQFANKQGNGGCDAGFYCNEAALCAPCDTDFFCGPSCSPCGGTARFCINSNGTQQCGECRDDADCGTNPNGGALHCDEEKHVCQECNEDKDCPHGKACEAHACVVCATGNQCAGNSCNCCPEGSNGKPMLCAPLDQSGVPGCVECIADSDCASPLKCDKLSGHCVDKIKDHSTPECCGDSCARCPEGFPFCLPGPVGTACAECRSDMDCDKDGLNGAEGGFFCLSGQCQSCTKDRRCGTRCTSCGGDTPYCLSDRTPETAACVRCVRDEQCAGGGTCNQETHACEKGCAMSCGPDTPYCDGEKCVACYADTQCPCNGTCDLASNTCSTSCKSNVDCLGNEHCKWNEDVTAKECSIGPMPGTECSRGLDQVLGLSESALETAPEFCGHPPPSAGGCTASGERERELTAAGPLGLLALALLGLRRRRGQS
uniref:TraA n=1 Tax=Byssovorax cruenta TaxID=293647 RepID=A0A410RAI0_9BACT|nr:TraA [Byssovorax cruenta]